MQNQRNQSTLKSGSLLLDPITTGIWAAKLNAFILTGTIN